MASSSQTGVAEAELIAGRYRVDRALGHGGVARVVRVLDTSRGMALALKRLEPSASIRIAELFELEAGVRIALLRGDDDGARRHFDEMQHWYLSTNIESLQLPNSVREASHRLSARLEACSPIAPS